MKPVQKFHIFTVHDMENIKGSLVYVFLCFRNAVPKQYDQSQ